MFSLAVFIFELIVIYILSLLFVRSFTRLINRFSNNQKLLIFIYSFLFLPGTIIHELSHFFMAAILFVPVGQIHILPEIVEDRVHLGTVSTAQTGIFRRTLIGLAPFFLGTTAIIISLVYLPTLALLWQKILVVYFIFEISNTMFSSQEDLSESWGLFVAITILVLISLYGLYYFRISINFDLSPLINILLFPLGINFLAFLIVRILCLAPQSAWSGRGAQHT
jgi:hypothetical protein